MSEDCDRTYRRAFLKAALASAAAGALAGCDTWRAALSPLCPSDPRYFDLSTPLTIDVHTHVFNASDLQIDAFLRLIIARDNAALAELGPILEQIGEWTAPSAGEERIALQQASEELQRCGGVSRSDRIAALRQDGYSRGRAALQNAVRGAEAKQALGARRFSGRSSAASLIMSLPEREAVHRAARGARAGSRARIAAGGIDLAGAIDFVLQQFQFRYVNVSDYLTTYSAGRTRKIDLMITHMVDYDWPIGRGEPTSTSLEQQVDIMGDIAVATGGRLHAFAPFCPMREVAFRQGLEPVSSLALVRRAVESRGCVGVKLYPPMGFAAFRNAENPASFWRQEWMRPDLVREGFGAALDEALADLYSWCVANDVPIMAHTNFSNGPSDKFERLVAPRYWKAARDQFPGLRLNFGHFGDTRPASRDGERGLELARLMTSEPDGSGRRIYADAGYFAESLSNPSALQRTLERLYRLTAAKGDASLAQRLMYGSDWMMMLIEGKINEAYLARFDEIYAALDRNPALGAQGRLSEQFFGWNAVRFLGLRRGDKARERLERFYASHGVSTPHWMKKVDDRGSAG